MRNLLGCAVPFLISSMENSGAYSWSQTTIYREIPRDHELHISKAEEKRKRKAAKLRALKGQQNDK